MGHPVPVQSSVLREGDCVTRPYNALLLDILQISNSSQQSSPLGLTTLQQGHHEMSQQPRRKQARPRRRSGDSVGACSSIDINKNGSSGLDSPPNKSPRDGERPQENGHNGGQQPENLSLKRPSSSPAINLVRLAVRGHHKSFGGVLVICSDSILFASR